MNEAKYMGLDVHQATISAAVLDSRGHLLDGVRFGNEAATILQFIQGLRGSLQVTLEEGTKPRTDDCRRARARSRRCGRKAA
jgi:hypothetical protein